MSLQDITRTKYRSRNSLSYKLPCINEEFALEEIGYDRFLL